MITIANPAKGWMVTPDYIEYFEDTGSIVFQKGSKKFWYNLPTGTTFADIVHGIEVCRGGLYRLPQ